MAISRFSRTSVSLFNERSRDLSFGNVGVVAEGGTTTSLGGYRIHTFTTVGSNSFTVTKGGNVEVLVVAGGGGGGGNKGGGGGAGGLIYNNAFSFILSI